MEAGRVRGKGFGERVEAGRVRFWVSGGRQGKGKGFGEGEWRQGELGERVSEQSSRRIRGDAFLCKIKG